MKNACLWVSFVLLAVSSSTAAADEESCRQLLVSELEAYPGSDGGAAYFRDAEKAYRDCRGPSLPLEIRVKALRKYGVARDVRGDAQAAKDAFREAIDILDRAHGDHTAVLIDTLDDAVLAEMNAHLRSEALAHASRALTLRKKQFGDESPESVIGTIKLGIAHATFGEYDHSEVLLRTAVRIAEKTCGPQCDALSEAYSGLYALYVSQGKDEEAKQYDAMALNARPARKPTSQSPD